MNNYIDEAELLNSEELAKMRELTEKPMKKVEVYVGLPSSKFWNLLPKTQNKNTYAEFTKCRNDSCRSVLKIVDALNNIIPGDFEDLIWLYRSACCVLLVRDNALNMTCRLNLVEKTFLFDIRDWDINPVHIHIICKSLWECLEDTKNLIFYCTTICKFSQMALYIAICLVWSALLRTAGKKIVMFRFHKFSELKEILESIDLEELKDKPDHMYTILELVSFLVNVVFLYKYKGKRFTNYFRYTRNDLEQLESWCLKTDRFYENIPQYQKYIEAYSMITEKIRFDILDKVNETYMQL